MNDLRDRIAEAIFKHSRPHDDWATYNDQGNHLACADAVIEALHPTVTDGRRIADLYEEVIRFWFGECFPNVSTPALLIDGIRGQLGGFVTEELIGREQRIFELSADLDHAERENRRLTAENAKLKR